MDKTDLSQKNNMELLPLFQNIRYFRFVKQMYLDMF
jgi:hypothetical protein